MGYAARARGTFEERKAAAVARNESTQKEWNERVDKMVEEQYAEHCVAHPELTDEQRAALRKNLIVLAEGLKRTPAPGTKRR